MLHIMLMFALYAPQFAHIAVAPTETLRVKVHGERPAAGTGIWVP